MDRNYNEINFLIVGDGTLKEKMQKVFDLNLNNNVKFTGHVSHEKVMNIFTLYLFSLQCQLEKFWSSILEADVWHSFNHIKCWRIAEVNLNEKTTIRLRQMILKLADLIIMHYKNNKGRYGSQCQKKC